MEPVIVVEHLHKRYRNVHAVNDVSFSVNMGEIYGILGPNGAGKTTTIEMLEGLRKRDEGTIRILGLDPDTHPYELRERIGIQFQSTSVQERMKVKEALQLFSSFYRNRREIDPIVNALGLEPYLDTPFGQLSGGWKQRVTLALATIHDPAIVFLDEPSAGLDPHARRELWELILQLRKEGKTIVLTTHYMEEAERLCDRVAMFHKGRILAVDKPQRLVATWGKVRYLHVESFEADEQRLRMLPGVSEVKRDGHVYHVFARDLQSAALHLFRLADEEGWIIRSFRFETGSLEDLFISLVKEESA
ncbi:ABC transporter ATP-binding protein [Polycladomyces subterraneus]|uniref:ABC transporter ATP-binding protein n=1 Tax=Polycladomyces subterraneus TaxID=1016997 RepID=A0ABT8INU8_9BACL|nr:ABC transporter ATP-binding protein [Polycladomyces subterraneus]MDN4593804.1 ABC transporter ATP-binding protein [Polycladomyces subterraneus]